MTDNMMQWAIRGAKIRLQELESEISEIVKQFPDIRGASGTRKRSPAVAGHRDIAADMPTRKRRKMSAAARKAIGDAQRKRWANQRASDKKTK